MAKKGTSRNPLTGLSGLQLKRLWTGKRTGHRCRNPLTGLSGLQQGYSLPRRFALRLFGRNPLTGLSGLQLLSRYSWMVEACQVAIPLRG